MRTAILLLVVSALLVSLAVCGECATEYVFAQANPEVGIAYTNPVWSPDGRSIAYVALPCGEPPSNAAVGPAGRTIHLATLAGGSWKHRLLAKDADWPVWSPDGKSVAVHQNGLSAVAVATGKTSLLIKQLPDGGIYFPQSWSPNGRYIVAMPTIPEAYKRLVLDIKTSKLLGITVGLSASWTSDSKLLSSVCAGPEVAEVSWLRLTDPTTGNFKTLLKDGCADGVVAPKGAGYAWLWIRHQPPKGEGLYRIDLKTGTLAKTVSCRAEELYWSPDGKQFAFLGKLVERSGMEPQYNLYVGNTQNWYFKIISKGAAKPTGNWEDRLRYVSWSPDSKSIAFVTGTGDIRIVKL